MVAQRAVSITYHQLHGKQWVDIGMWAFLWEGRGNQRANQLRLGLWRWMQVQQAGDADGSWQRELGEDQETPLLKEAVSSAWKTLI